MFGLMAVGVAVYYAIGLVKSDAKTLKAYWANIWKKVTASFVVILALFLSLLSGEDVTLALSALGLTIPFGGGLATGFATAALFDRASGLLRVKSENAPAPTPDPVGDRPNDRSKGKG